MQTTKTDQSEAMESLLKMLKPGDSIYTITRHVSRSGMMRRISVYAIKNNKPIGLDWYIKRLGLFNLDKTDDGIVVNGCGMDMHFHVVHTLGRALFPKGFKLVKGMHGRNGDKSGYESDGGYAFNKVSL